jgi:hypothetical protein
MLIVIEYGLSLSAAPNVNFGLGRLGIDGVKAGSTRRPAAAWCFSASRKVAGRPATLVGAVLGVPASRASPAS